MEVRRLALADMRAWEEVAVAFEGSTVLVGSNGTGKTTLLEAIHYGSTLSSHRTASDQTMIRRGADRAVIRIEVARPRVESIELEIAARGRSRAQLGGAPVASRREVLGVLRTSLFAPERLSVIRGEPGERRGFADELLVMLHPRYHGTIREYERALRQRNRLLRAAAEEGASLEGIEAWDATLLSLASEICAGRARAIARLAPHAQAAYDAVGAGSSFVVRYLPRCEHPGDEVGVEAWMGVLRAKMEDRRDLERIRGTTLVGPHRDDLEIVIDGLPARTHASHGEGWLAALALSLAAHSCIADVAGDPPVLLLDDPFTLLDPKRRSRLVGALPEGQVLATAADPAEIPDGLPAARIDVEELLR